MNANNNNSNNSGNNNKRRFYSKNNKFRNNNPHNTKGQGVRPPNQENKDQKRVDRSSVQTNAKTMSSGRNHFRRPEHHNNQNRDPFENILRKYELLLEQHISARKKYFDQHGQIDIRNLKKLEQTYHTTQKQFYDFELSLTPEQKAKLAQRNGEFPLDQDYSKAHEMLNYTPDPIDPNEKVDPHTLDSQRKVNFISDTEESIGTLEDYQKLKGNAT